MTIRGNYALLRARHNKARPITESALIFASIMSVDRVRRARESFPVSSIVAILILAPDTKAKKTDGPRFVALSPFKNYRADQPVL